MLPAYLLCASTILSVINFNLKDNFCHGFTTSSVGTSIRSAFPANFGSHVASSDKMTSLFLRRGDVDDLFGDSNNSSDDHDDDGERYGDQYAFDLDSARERLESLVAAVGNSPLEEQQVSSSSAAQQQQQRTTLTNIQFLTDKGNAQSKQISVTGGASIASSPSMFDVVERPPLRVNLPQRPPLTSIDRERRMAEIEILKILRDNHDDDAIADLWSVWFAERGPQAEAILKEADELMGGRVRDQLEAERLLRSLIEEYGVYFAEPVNRLATLYFTQGRLEESLALNKIVLAVKPWHVGALSHIVMVYEAKGDSMTARSWARFRFPSLSRMGNSKRREQWVQRAINDANRMLEQGEANNAMSFGEQDRIWIGKQLTAQLDTDDEIDTWQ